MKKIGLLCLALVLALGTLGVGFALWSETLYIDGTVYTGELDWEFECGTVTVSDPCTPPTADKNCDNDFQNVRPAPGDKNVGCTDVVCVDSDGDGDVDTLQVTLNNVYPCYYVHIGYFIHNNGSIPLKFERCIISGGGSSYAFTSLPCLVDLDLDGDGDLDLNLRFGDNFGVQLHPCDSMDQSFDLHVKQGSEQGTTYTFTIELEAVQWNESIHPD